MFRSTNVWLKCVILFLRELAIGVDPSQLRRIASRKITIDSKEKRWNVFDFKVQGEAVGKTVDGSEILH